MDHYFFNQFLFVKINKELINNEHNSLSRVWGIFRVWSRSISSWGRSSLE
uniref:Uncharacterized protein n=1 Tax=Lepeophtheirus salmonis TaxID=72036 RepID=A0A0K2VFE8_LEPSM